MPQTPEDDRKARVKRQAWLLALAALGVYAAYLLFSFLS